MKSEEFTTRSRCPIRKLGKLNNRNNFSRGFPGQASEVGVLLCYPGELPHEWLHTLSIQHSLFVSQTIHSFPERVPRVGLRGWCLMVLPWELPHEWLEGVF